KHRLAALIAKLAGQLPQPLRLDRRILAQLLTDPVLERIQLRPGRRPLVLRRRLALDRPGDRVAMRPGQPMDRALGALLDEVQPSDLSPLLHADHTLLLARSQDQARVRDQPDASDSTPGGPVFNRRRWSSIQAAPTR